MKKGDLLAIAVLLVLLSLFILTFVYAVAPVINGVSILPAFPSAINNLSANISGDDVNYTFSWYRNNQPIMLLNLPMTNASWVTTTNQTTYDYSSFGHD